MDLKIMNDCFLKCRRCEHINKTIKIEKYTKVYDLHCEECNNVLYTYSEETFLKLSNEEILKHAYDFIENTKKEMKMNKRVKLTNGKLKISGSALDAFKKRVASVGALPGEFGQDRIRNLPGTLTTSERLLAQTNMPVSNVSHELSNFNFDNDEITADVRFVGVHKEMLESNPDMYTFAMRGFMIGEELGHIITFDLIHK